ncbi:MAG: glycosyltransferase [Chloroflexi bacterium]|nr:glycosyltransferase [Chloroflexota bacterium]
MSVRSSRQPIRPAIVFIVGQYEPSRCGVAHYTQRLVAALDDIGLPSLVLTAQPSPNLPDGLSSSPHVSLTPFPLSASSPLSAPAPIRNDPLRNGGLGGEVRPGARIAQMDCSWVNPEARGVISEWSLATLQPLARSIVGYDPAVVHVQHAPTAFSGHRAHLFLPLALRSLGLRFPVVTTVHEYGGWSIGRKLPVPVGWAVDAIGALGERFGWWDRELLTLLSRGDAVIATNADHAALLRRALGPRHHRLAEIPLAENISPVSGDPLDHRRALRAELGVPADAPVLLFFGFVHPVKGIETLLAAFAAVQTRRPDARLWVVGGVESLALRGEEARAYQARLFRLATELGIDGHVEWTGHLPDQEVSRRLFAADLCVLPFRRGATLKSGSLRAAFAHGCPVVTTRSAEPDPALRHGETVLLVAPNDPAELAVASERLLDDSSLRALLAGAGQRLTRAVSWHEIALRHLRLYAGVAPEIFARAAATPTRSSREAYY